MLLNFTVLSLILVGSSASCGKKQVVNNNDNGVWVCNPESNVTITLTFDSENILVNTSPQDLSSKDINPTIYLFHNGDRYIMRGDTLHFVNPNSNAPDYGFVRTMLSPDSMKLQSYGLMFTDICCPTYITNYLFIHKLNYSSIKN